LPLANTIAYFAVVLILKFLKHWQQDVRIDGKFDLWEPTAKDGGVAFGSRSTDLDEELEEGSAEVAEPAKK
jgi:hypothetical protein